jgi:predicted NAD-dependent protein-ADP-ribosyltransferase YbiA (DUF1768 family)/SAM-dependent methyltransferase
MELSKQEVQEIQNLLGVWKTRPEIELEATFGFKGIVDQQTFLRVISRLRSKGYHAISQEDRLTISLQDHLRFTLTGSGDISQYCRDNTLVDKEYIALIKDRTITHDQLKNSNIDLKDYDVRVKARREIELSKDDPRVQEALQGWPKRRKYFRLIRRWSYSIPGLKFDLSMVRSTQRDSAGNQWQFIFHEKGKPILSSLAPNYEIEVELDRSGFTEKDEPNAQFKTLIRGIGEVLRGIQGCPILTRKSTKDSVLRDYKELTKTDRFRGVAPVTLEVKNMVQNAEAGVPNIRTGYNVTDKADGLRVHGFTDKTGELFMIDMAMNVYRTGFRNQSCKESLLDGEYVTHDKEKNPIQALLFFDIYYINSKDVTDKAFKDTNDECRFTAMNRWIYEWNKDGGPTHLLQSATLTIGVKEFSFPSDESDTIFLKASEVLSKKESRNYYTDGLIFTPNTLPIPKKPGVAFLEQFKWKPAEDNSIDFLVTTLKDPLNKSMEYISVSIHPTSNETVRYKTLQLFVGSSEDPAYNDPRATILNDLPLPGSKIGGPDPRYRYKPVPFVPKEIPDSKAAICYLQTQFDPKTGEEFIITENNEPIRDRSIVEMRYDTTQPPGWRWIPIRVRTDKTERLLKGRLDRTLNSEKTAESIWNSIHDPITLYMIQTGSESPSMKEIKDYNIQQIDTTKKYYERKASEDDLRKVNGLRKFHNIYIKDTILYKAISVNKGDSLQILDLTVGKGADLQRWRRSNASFVLGTDIMEDNIRNIKDGVYRRLLDTIVENQGKETIAPMFFVTADSSKRLIDGSAGFNPEEGDILRSILGRVDPVGPIPIAIEKRGKGVLSKGADVVSCMHSLHYFFQNSAKFNGFLQNIADTLKIGGHFIGTNVDGTAIFDLLRETENGKSYAGMEGDTILWEIEKQYSGDELPNDDSIFGMSIGVYFISIGMKHIEYLVPWDFFVAKMKTIGCELLEPQELVKLGLQSSSNMYSKSYEMAMGSKDKNKFSMSEIVQKFSFLHRWYIFKRTSQGTGQIGTIVGDVEVTEEDEGEYVINEGDEDLEDLEGVDGIDVVQSDQGVQGVQGLQGLQDKTDTKNTLVPVVKPRTVVRKGTTALPKKDMSELANLSSKIQDSATVTDLMTSIIPGSAAAAAQMLQRVEEATARKDRETLRKLNQQAHEIQTAQAKEKGLPIPPPPSGAPGAYAKAFASLAPGAAAVLTVPIRADTGGADIGGFGKDVYKASEVFQFYEKSDEVAKYINLPEKYVKGAARHMSPNAPFRIHDTTDKSDTKEYPSIIHFLAGMKFKYASAKPEIANDVFSREGSVHTYYLAQRQAEQKGKPQGISQSMHNKYILDETTDVKTQESKYMKTKTVGFDETKWATVKDNLLREAIIQRLKNDKWFCEILSAAIAQNKYLLYFDKSASENGSELGGSRTLRGSIQGQNKYGKLLVELAKSLPDDLKACLELPDPS